MSMCDGANSNAARINRIDLLVMPLIRKTADGMMDRVNALNIPFFFQQTIQSMQYNATSSAFTMRYTAKDSLDAQPNQVPGMLKIIKPKQPNLPICSTSSTVLFL